MESLTKTINLKFSVAYVLSVVAINVAFTYIPPVILFDGTIWSVGSVIAGIVFIARDYAQIEVGHRKVLLLMAMSCLISYLMADPFVALASATAFAMSELIDYLVYTFKSGSHKSKVIFSSLLSVPVDTFVFLFVIDSISSVSFIVMCASKLVAVLFVIRK